MTSSPVHDRSEQAFVSPRGRNKKEPIWQKSAELLRRTSFHERCIPGANVNPLVTDRPPLKDNDHSRGLPDIPDTTDDETDSDSIKNVEMEKQFDDFLRSTTFHGLNQIFNSSRWMTRVFWTCIFVLVFGIVTIQLRKLFFYFVDNPTVTSINVVYPTVGLEIPPITICMLKKLNRTRVNQMFPKVTRILAELSTATFWSAYSTALTDVDYFVNQVNLTSAELEPQLFEALDGHGLADFIEKTSFSCENQFLMCWFENGNVFNCCDESENGTNQFLRVKRHITHSGACYELALNKERLQRLPGPVGGVGFVYWFPSNETYRTAFNSYNEFAVQMYMSPEDAMIENNPISLPIGFHSKINLMADRVQRQETDELGRSQCEHPKLKYHKQYSYEACQVECLIATEMAHCNCTGVHFSYGLPRDRLCTPSAALNCFRTTVDDFPNFLVQCRRENCSEACAYWSYKASLTVSRAVNPCCVDELIKYWRLPEGGNPSESLVIADIYYGDIQYTLIEQKAAFSIETFVSSLGGAMGLWTGASIVTWVHLLYFCCAACFDKRAPSIRDHGRFLRRKLTNKNKQQPRARQYKSHSNGALLKYQPSNGLPSGFIFYVENHTEPRKWHYIWRLRNQFSIFISILFNHFSQNRVI